MFLPEGTLLHFGEYQITRFINSGGFGCTYEARHVELDKRVAIKEFFVKDYQNRDVTSNQISVGITSKQGLVDKLQKKFKDEARALAKMKHPGVVSVTAIFEENGTAYYVMDYIEGCSLGELVGNNEPLPEDRAVDYICQVADALSYVHSQNRLHLDIKPGNIMLSLEESPILIDFGVSKQYDDENGVSPSTLVGLTPGYAPPEQMSCELKLFSAASDIYSLGATLYYLLTGTAPVNAAKRGAGIELDPLPANISQPVRVAIEKAMSLKISDRPQSADEFVSLLSAKLVENRQRTVISDDSKKTVRISSSNDKDSINTMRLVEQSQNREEFKEYKEKDESQASDEVQEKRRKYDAIAPIMFIGVFLLLFGLLGWWSWRSKNLTKSDFEGIEYVDLGLPSGTKWATCNVGASSPWEYGEYYDSGGTDGVRSNMPSKDQFEELIDKCQWEWIEGKGYKVIGPNGKSICLPAAGIRDHTSELRRQVERGEYWSGSPYSDSQSNVYYLHFDDSDVDMDWWFDGGYGRSVRGVVSE